MKTALIFLLGALAYVGFDDYQKRESYSEALQELDQKSKEIEQIKSDNQAQLEQYKSQVEQAKSTLDAAQKKQQEEIQQLQQQFEEYKQKYKVSVRQKAVGEQLEVLRTNGGIEFKQVKITNVNPAQITFLHSNGVGRVLFTDLSEEWRDRFQYDAVEAVEFKKKDNEEQLRRAQFGQQEELAGKMAKDVEFKVKVVVVRSLHDGIVGEVYKEEEEVASEKIAGESAMTQGVGIQDPVLTSVHKVKTYDQHMGTALIKGLPGHLAEKDEWIGTIYVLRRSVAPIGWGNELPVLTTSKEEATAAMASYLR